jgi:predicted unusual protein kinase regulating ubiquinone biosynthesis (AarF/ABC1/UbiB family)
VIPRFYTDYCSDRVIVMDFMEGAKITEVEKIK